MNLPKEYNEALLMQDLQDFGNRLDFVTSSIGALSTLEEDQHDIYINKGTFCGLEDILLEMANKLVDIRNQVIQRTRNPV